MTRSRLNLKLISSESARKVTFRKRKKGLVKKMEEITTLCGIDACMVIYNPQENVPNIWPSMEKAMELMVRYDNMPKKDQDIKKVDHEKFMENRVENLLEHIEKAEKKNKEARANLLMYQLTQGKTIKDLNNAEVELLHWFSELKINEINRRVDLLPPIGLIPLQDPSQLLLTPQIPLPPPSSFFPHTFEVEPSLPPLPPTLFSPLIPNPEMCVGGGDQNEESMMMEASSHYGDEHTLFNMNMFHDGDASHGGN